MKSRPGPQPSTSSLSSGNFEAQALSATQAIITEPLCKTAIPAYWHQTTTSQYIGESHFLHGVLLAIVLVLELLPSGPKIEYYKHIPTKVQSTVLIPSSIRLCLLMKRRSRCSLTQGLLFFTLITGVTLRSCLVLLVSLKWLGTGLSRSESMS